MTPDQLADRLHIPHQRRDPLLAAAALEAATEDMHAAAVAAGPPLTAEQFAAAVDPVPDPVAAAQDAIAAAYAQLDAPAPLEDLPDPVPVLAPEDHCSECHPELYRARCADGGCVAQSPAVVEAAALDYQDAAPTPEPPAPAVQVTEPAALSGWAPRHDPRSRLYGVRDHALTGSAPLTDVLLPGGPVLDQGGEGACVGFGAADAANSLALVRWKARGYGGAPADLLDAADALAAYHRAQELDDVPGTGYDGTSVLAGMKAGQERQWWHSYWWSFSVRDTAQTLLQLGTPLVIGVPWFRAMMTPEPGGVVRVAGDFLDGHCVAVRGLRLTGPGGLAGPWFVVQNSYGPAWGDGGLGLIHHRDLAFLLTHDGEQAIPQAAS
jgi:hypothetical protein